MRSLPDNSTAAMATDVDLSHTMEDDITFERVRHMPRRTQFVSTHRKLSWQHDKALKQFERDLRLSNTEMTRAKTAMAEKFTRLQDAKRQLQMQKSEEKGDNRRNSAPCLPDPDRCVQKEAVKTKAASNFPHSYSVSSFADMVIPETPTADQRSGERPTRTVVVASMPRSVAQGTSGVRRATIAEGVTQGSHLPPSLQRRLSQFLDSTAVPLGSQKVTDSQKDKKKDRKYEEFDE